MPTTYVVYTLQFAARCRRVISFMLESLPQDWKPQYKLVEGCRICVKITAVSV
jgi:hypothetical protein